MQKILDTPWTRSTIAKGHTESQEDSEAKNFMITVFFLLYPHFFPPSLAPLPPFKSLHPSLLLPLTVSPCLTPASPPPLPRLDLSLNSTRLSLDSPLSRLASPSSLLSLPHLHSDFFTYYCFRKTLDYLELGVRKLVNVVCAIVHSPRFLADQSPEWILGSASFSSHMMLLSRHFSLEVTNLERQQKQPGARRGCAFLQMVQGWISSLERTWIPGEISFFIFVRPVHLKMTWKLNRLDTILMDCHGKFDQVNMHHNWPCPDNRSCI